MTPLCSRRGLVGPVQKGMWQLCWTNHRYGWNLGSLIWTNLKCQSNEWKHPGSPHPKKVSPTQCAVKVMFIVAYDNVGVTLHYSEPTRQMIKASYYCMFLQHHLRPALRGKQRHLVAQNPRHSSWQSKESHRCCYRPLVPLPMGDSRTSTILTWYESMWLWSLCQSMYIWSFRVSQHLRSLVPIMNNDLWW